MRGEHATLGAIYSITLEQHNMRYLYEHAVIIYYCYLMTRVMSECIESPDI